MKCPACKKDIILPLKLGATIGATQLKGCPECGAVFIILQTKNNLINETKTHASPSQSVGKSAKEVFGDLDKLRGYRPPKRKAEAASIIRMLKNYTPAQIIMAWETLKQDKFWRDKELFMMTVESQIGAMLNKMPAKTTSSYSHMVVNKDA